MPLLVKWFAEESMNSQDIPDIPPRLWIDFNKLKQISESYPKVRQTVSLLALLE